MADTTATTPATPAPANDAPPTAADPAAAAPAPEVKPAPSIAELKAQRREKAAVPKAPAPPASASGGSTSSSSTNAAPATSGTPAPAAPKPGETTAQVNVDADALKSFTDLQKRLRATETESKALKERIAGFGKFEKAQALAKDGKHYDAAREAGIDVDAALAELLNKSPDATAGQIDKKLADEIAELKAFRDEVKAEREAKKQAEAKQAEEAGKGLVVKFVGDNATKYPYLAKAPELIHAALKDADKEYETSKADLEDGEDLSDADKNKILFKHLEAHEAKWAKTFGPAATETTTEAPGVDGAARAGVRQPAPEVKKKLTWDELKAERLAKRKTA